jgi:hypothetical protein
MLNGVIILLLALIIHEIGHFLAWDIQNIEPKIRLTWFGVEVGSIKQIFQLNILNAIFVYSMGILFGAGVIAYFNVTLVGALLYVLLCSGDIVQIVSLIELGLKYGFNEPVALANSQFMMEMEFSDAG